MARPLATCASPRAPCHRCGEQWGHEPARSAHPRLAGTSAHGRLDAAHRTSGGVPGAGSHDLEPDLDSDLDLYEEGQGPGDAAGDLPPDRFLDRELSWLAFNERVLELAEDPATPLLERANFLAIFASNLDEFFMVRVAGLKRRIATGVAARSAAGSSRARCSSRSGPARAS